MTTLEDFSKLSVADLLLQDILIDHLRHPNNQIYQYQPSNHDNPYINAKHNNPSPPALPLPIRLLPHLRLRLLRQL